MSPLETLIGLLAPLICRGCGKEGSVLCDACAGTVSVPPSRCYRCHKATKQYQTCPSCRRVSGLRRVVPLAQYQGVVVDVLHALKYERLQSAARELVVRLPLPMELGTDTLFVPVPTTAQRVRVRGYDQAVLLARAFTRVYGGSSLLCLQRISQNHQVGASGRLRRQQLVGAFKVRSGVILPSRVVLVDDVLTTGSTLEEAAKTLRAAGVKTVDALVIAQA